ncbi:MAG: hypothetical protein GYB68_06540 [Chloroflexi bacterium]|nr:hypothetical protein [Chloroflexota bacterium]
MTSTPHPPVQIHEIDTRQRRDVERFVRFPFDLYCDTPQWVPPILMDVRRQLSRKRNPFYEQGDAIFLMAEQAGQDVGRLAVLEPQFYNQYTHRKEAFFYFFEAIHNRAVAHALFNYGARWAKAKGLEVMRGPLGFLAFDGFGLLAKGFEHRPAVGIPYNHAYYVDLVESWHFKLEERIHSGYMDLDRHREEFSQKILRVSDKVMKRYGFEVVTFPTNAAIKRSVRDPMVKIYNEALTHIAGDAPVSDEQVETIMNQIAFVAQPDLLKFIQKDGEIVGFLFCLLDVSAGIQKAEGRLLPFGFLRILAERRRTDWINLNGMGILPEYQGLGGTAILYAELYRTVKAHTRFKHGDVVQISENNPQVLNEMKNFGIDFYKTHHLYRAALTDIAL